MALFPIFWSFAYMYSQYWSTSYEFFNLLTIDKEEIIVLFPK